MPNSRVPAILVTWFALMAVGIVLLILVLGAGGGSVQAEYTLTPLLHDTGGLAPRSQFRLESSEPLAVSQVEKMLAVSPAVAFQVEKNGETSFTIAPQEPLREDTVYQFVIARGPNAAREYQWAWQTKAPFQVVGSNPGHKSTGVPVNTAIVLTLNRERFARADDFFSIEPAVAGQLETRHEQLSFIPQQPLAPETIYTVRLKEGLPVAGSDDTLAKTFSIQFQTASADGFSGSAYFYLEPIWEQAPGQEILLRADVHQAQRSQPVETTLIQFTDDQAFLTAWKKSHQSETLWATYRNLADTSGQTPLFTGNLTLETQAEATLLHIPRALAGGYYLVDAELAGQRRQTWLIVSPIVSYLAGGTDSLLWLKDQASGQGVAAKLEADGMELGRTDTHGVATFTTPSPLPNPPFLVAVTDNSRRLISLLGTFASYLVLESGVGEANNKWWETVTVDKTVYQPSDTIRFWALLVPRAGAALGKEPITVEFGPTSWSYDGVPDRRAFAQTSVTSSDFSTVRGELSYKDIAPGYYELRFKRGSEVIASRNLDVEAVTKPAYQITLTPERLAAINGSSLNLAVEAKFFDGTPVAGLALRASADENRQLAPTELTLDSQGRGTLTYTPHLSELRGFTYDELVIQPAVAEESDLVGATTVVVFPAAIGFRDTSAYDTKGMNLRLTLHQLDFSDLGMDPSRLSRSDATLGQALAGRHVSVEVVEVAHDRIETGRRYDPISQTTEPIYEWRERLAPIRTETVTTNGQGGLDRRVDVPAGKTYRIRATASDEQGRTVILDNYAYGRSASPEGGTSQTRVRLLDDADSYRLDQTVTASVLDEAGQAMPDGNDKFLFFRTQNGRQRQAVVQANGRFESRFTAEDIPNVYLGNARWDGTRFFDSTPANITFDEETRRLQIETSGLAKEYRPGETVALDLVVRDPENKGREAEVLVGALDEASFQLNPEEHDPVRELYQDLGRGVTIATSHRSALETGAEGGCVRAGTLVRLANGQEVPIETIMPGTSLTTFDPNRPETTIPVVVRAVRPYLTASGYRLLNGRLGITGNHPVYSKKGWQTAAAIGLGDELLTQNGWRMVETIEDVPTRTLVYNLEVNGPHTYLADGVLIHNAEKAGGSIRQQFEDVATWQTVTTDRAGKGEASFKLPDSITSWRVSLVAATKDLMIGKRVMHLPVSLPFFLNASLNTTYLTEDEPVLRLRAFGGAVTDQPITYTVTSAALSGGSKTATGGPTFELPLGTLPVGTHTLDLRATQGEQTDAIRRTIRVASSRLLRPETTFKPATVGPVELPAGRGRVEVTVVDRGRGAWLPELHRLAALYGNRFDQVAVQTLAARELGKLAGQTDTGTPNLGAYQTASGIQLFPHSEPDLDLSARTALLETELPSLQRGALATYLRGALIDNRADQRRRLVSLAGLAALGEPTLTGLRYHLDAKRSLADTIWLGLGLAAAGDKEGARVLFREELAGRLERDGSAWRLSGLRDTDEEIRYTALVGVLAAELNLDEAEGLAHYTMTQEPTETLTTLEQFLIIERLMAQATDTKSALSYTLSGGRERYEFPNGQSLSLSLEQPPSGSPLTIETVEGEVGLVMSHWSEASFDQLPRDPRLGLSRRYLVAGKETTTFREGDLVQVELTPKVASGALDGNYGVVDILPSGLVPTTKLGDLTDPSEQRLPTALVDGRAYFCLCGERRDVKLVYFARVVSKGTYQAEPALIYREEMGGGGAASPSALVVIE